MSARAFIRKAIVSAALAVAMSSGVVGAVATPTPDTTASPDATPTPDATATPDATPTAPPYAASVIGRSVRGRAIRAYRFGRGTKRLLVIGGVHGNEWGDDVAWHW